MSAGPARPVGDPGADALVADGVARYTRGDLAGAVAAWERALRVDPASARAQEYLTYVRDKLPEAVPVATVPVDSGAYESIHVSDDHPPAPADDVATVDLDAFAGDDLPDDVFTGIDVDPFEPHPREPLTPPLSRGGELPLRAGAFSSFGDDAPTRDHGVRGLIPHADAFDDFSAEHSNAHVTNARRTVDLGREPLPAAPAVIVDDAFLAALAAAAGDIVVAPGDDPATRPDADLEHTQDFRPGRQTTNPERALDRLRRRATELLRRAERSAGGGDYNDAVDALEAAALEDADGVVLPALLLERRELVYRIYEGHIGDLNAVPLVAVPLHEIAAQRLNHRTGFLLSRIDGMLSFEDVLDVAGMPRMEAYKIISSLLRRGMIEVR